MPKSKINIKLFLTFSFCLFLKLIFCTEPLNSFGMKYAKTLQLYNGNIIVVGDIGINTYDNTGMKSLYNYTITENKIESEADAYLTTLVQFPMKNNGLVLIFVKYKMYIFDSNGNFLFKYQPPSLSISMNIDFFTIVPYIQIDNNYHFILAYLNENRKAYLQYFIINIEDEEITFKFDYIFDQDEPERNGVDYSYGISCQIMEHKIYEETLVCFYQNNIMQKEIAAKHFKIHDTSFQVISELEGASYKDTAFCILSQISINKKNCLLCYVQNDESSKYNGICSIYNIDENKFINYKKYLDYNCQAHINHLTLNYYKETKQYIFSCTGTSANVHIIIFDENYNVVEINSGSDTMADSTISIPNCYFPYFYSILFLSNEYTILGDFKCEGSEISTLYNIPDEYKPSEIYTDYPEEDSKSEESSYSENNEESSENNEESSESNEESSENNEESSESNEESSESNEESSENNEQSSENNEESSESNEESSERNEQSSESSENEPSNPDTVISYSSNEVCHGYRNSDGTICSDEVPIGYYILDLLNKILGKCHISCETCIKGPDDISNNCQNCNENFELNEENNCFYKFNYYFNKTINKIIYLLSNEFCPDILPYEIISTKECVENCEIIDFINKKCKINSFSENNGNSITDNLRKIVNYINDSNFDIIIDGNNIIYEIKSSEIKIDYNNISLIDFGECEKILKEHYSLNYLIIFKTDIKVNDSYPTKVDYEIYSPKTKQKLELSLCENTKIDIYVPTSLDNYTYDLYNSANKYGYDIFNENNSFYKDLCTPFTSQDGTDILLYDRQIHYYNNSIPLCESNCVYQSFDNTNKKAKCQCQIKKEFVSTKRISYKKMNITNLLNFKTVSNIELIKCYKLTFSLEGMTKNYGSKILGFCIVSYLALIIIYLINRKTSISKILKRILKMNSFENNPPKKKHKNLSFSVYDKFRSNEMSDKQQSQLDLNSMSKKSLKRKNKIILKIKNYQNINVIKNTNLFYKPKQKKILSPKGKLKKDSSLKNLKKKKNSFYKKNRNIIDRNNDNTNSNYLDEELNDLEYNIALIVDKRTFFQYYWGQIKRKHLILSILISFNDLNLIYIKIGLFIMNFCLYFVINALFFTDQTMQKIYEDKGLFKILIHIPHIIYSSVISAVINMILKKFALSEKGILDLKKEKRKNLALEKATLLYRTLIIMFNLYFSISSFLLILFWYYITTFCAVYRNTQMILIENTLICFGFTLVYPFGLYLLPGIFRIPALRASNKDKEYLYKFSNLISLIL